MCAGYLPMAMTIFCACAARLGPTCAVRARLVRAAVRYVVAVGAVAMEYLYNRSLGKYQAAALSYAIAPAGQLPVALAPLYSPLLCACGNIRISKTPPCGPMPHSCA